jgi:hypothetical protein
MRAAGGKFALPIIVGALIGVSEEAAQGILNEMVKNQAA